MTIIAVRDGIMAADRQVSDGNLIAGTCCKIVAVPDHVGGGFAAGAGDLGALRKALSRFEAGRPDDLPDGEYTVLWMMADGKVRAAEGGDWVDFDADFYAVGSGTSVAMGALVQGASAKEAVEAACRLCIDCGGGMDARSVNQ